MQLTELNVLDTGRRVQGFLDSQSAALGTTVPAPLRAKLDAAVAQLATSQLEQGTLVGSTLGEVAKQRSIRKELNADFLRPMARIARLTLRDDPDFTTLVVPAVVPRHGDFLTKVNAVADVAAKHEQDFVDHGMPADFIAQLRAAVTQLNASTDARATQLGQLSAAGKGIKDSTKAVRDLLHVMDGNVKRALKKNQPLLANWVATKRIQATVVTPLPGGDASVTSVAPAPATTTPATPAV